MCSGSESPWPVRCYYLVRNLFQNKSQAIEFCIGTNNIAKPGCVIKLFKDYYTQFLWVPASNNTVAAYVPPVNSTLDAQVQNAPAASPSASGRRKRQPTDVVNSFSTPPVIADVLAENQCVAGTTTCNPKPTIDYAYSHCYLAKVPSNPQWEPITIQSLIDLWTHQAEFDFNW